MAVTQSSQVEAITAAGRSGIGLCLSGGGFRAALFHLGALRRLHELGILQQVRSISSVSGGSILAGHLVQCQRDSGQGGRLSFTDWQKDVSDKFRSFAGRDLRTWPVLKNVLWNWLRPGPLLADLEGRYRNRLTKLRLQDLPETPEYVFCATDLTFGVNWEFSKQRVGSYAAGYTYESGRTDGDNDTPVAHAVTASACFPPLFGPMRVSAAPSAFGGGSYQGANRQALLKRLSLSDGGVYDNMALEPVWKSAATVLVSDCGAPFDYVEGKEPWRTLLRYSSVMSRQTQSLRIRMLQAAWGAPAATRPYDGTRWHLASGKSPASVALPGGVAYSASLAHSKIAEIRTDLDSFSDAEMSILENHGYCNADYRIRTALPNLVPAGSPNPVPPYPDWMDEKRAAEALKDSGKRLVPQRLLKGLFT